MSNSKGDTNCGKCDKELPKDGEHAICRLCKLGFHFDECSMKKSSWKGLGDARRATWLCYSCRIKEKSSSVSQDDEFTPQDVSGKLDKLMQLIPSVQGIQASLDFLQAQYDDILKEVKELRKENKVLKEEQGALKKKMKDSEETITLLTTRLNDLDQYGRRVNLEIHGVFLQGSALEPEKIEEVVKDLGQKIGLPFVPEDVHKMHRMQKRSDGKPPAILIQFMSCVKRDAWLLAGKKAKLTDRPTGRKIFFNENLTAYNRALLKDTKMRATAHHYSFVWFQSGKILVKKDENTKNIIVIKSYGDLNKIG